MIFYDWGRRSRRRHHTERRAGSRYWSFLTIGQGAPLGAARGPLLRKKTAIPEGIKKRRDEPLLTGWFGRGILDA